MKRTITPAKMANISDAEIAFSTDKLLPDWAEIPQQFKDGNLYTRIAETLFFGGPMPDCEIKFHDGFDGPSLNRAVQAHLGSFKPKHEHKIAGVGYMISMAATVYKSTSLDA